MNIKNLDQATGLAMLHNVTQVQADLFISLFDGNMIKAKRMCEFVDKGTPFFEVYMIASIAKGEQTP